MSVRAKARTSSQKLQQIQKQFPFGNDRKKRECRSMTGCLYGSTFESHGDRVAAAEAEGGNSPVGVATLHLV
jgi:hypothetical protein